MTKLCCNPECWKGAHPDGHPLSGFCCTKCIFKLFSEVDFEQIGRGDVWYQVGKKGHYKHCCNSQPTQERAERPLLTSAMVDDILDFCKSPGPTSAAASGSQPASSSQQPAAASSSSLQWQDASHARLLQHSENRPASVYVLRHVNMILNMPVVIICLTYEGSDGDPWIGLDEHHCVRFYGRAAKLEPKCASHSAVSSGILHILDFMANDEWDSDTRFIFLEEDWRPHTEDAMDPMGARDVIERMVQVAIAAASDGMGDFVWLSWEQHKKRGMWPSYGNLAQVYTVPFARNLREHTKTKNPTDQHWDVFLLQYLQSRHCTLGTCFCKPSLGGYYSHLSGCEDKLAHKERECDWTAYWRAEMVGALSEVELQSFKDSRKVVTHTFDPDLRWQHRLRKRAVEEQRLSGVWGATLPTPSDPADDSIFAAEPPNEWTKRQKRNWREKRKLERLRNPEGDDVVQPGIFTGPVADETFGPLSLERTFNTGCIRFPSSSQSQESSKDFCLPCFLYLYWEQGWGDAPIVVQKCAQKAQEILEATPWVVLLMDEDSVWQYLPPSDLHFYLQVRNGIQPPMRSDLIRLMILHRRGGVWCDASNVLTDDLQWLSRIFDEHDAQIFAFSSPQQDTVLVQGCQVPLLESWFIACVPECPLIGQWLLEFKRALLLQKTEESLTGYMERVASATARTENGSVNFHKIPPGMREYLLIHVTQQYVLQTSSTPLPDWKIETLPSGDGPFLLHHRFHWSTKKMAAAILRIGEEAQNTLEAPPYFIKLRGGERDELERRHKNGHGDDMNWLASCRASFHP